VSTVRSKGNATGFVFGPLGAGIVRRMLFPTTENEIAWVQGSPYQCGNEAFKNKRSLFVVLSYMFSWPIWRGVVLQRYTTKMKD